ncbi:MAG: hypothetical protein ACRDOH_04040 [Streptosporangiaceae bacterium]
MTAQVVLPLPPTAVTSRISEPIATLKFGAGNPVSLVTVIDVSVAAIGAASVVLAESRLATVWRTVPSAVPMSVWVICVVVGHAPLRAAGAPAAAAAATVPCWARVTLHVVSPAPLTAVTRRISAPIET